MSNNFQLSYEDIRNAHVKTEPARQTVKNNTNMANNHTIHVSNKQMLLNNANLPTGEKNRRLATALRQSGQSYIRRNGKVCEKIKFEYLKCSCQFDCKHLTIEMRRDIFNRFWLLGNWDDQTAFICSTVVQVILFFI